MKTAWRLMACICAAGLAVGCADKGDKPGVVAPPVVLLPPPEYADVARAYNENAKHLSQFFCPVVVRIVYTDREGEVHKEQGEGRLQIVQPDHVAMSIGKVGEVFFWLGSDSQRYWWIDKSGSPRVMFTGGHDSYERSQARRIGVVVPPLDLVRLLGIVKLPQTGGQTQRSTDGKLVGVTVALENAEGARQRTWINPATNLATKIELWNAKGECELVADLSDPDGVDVKGIGWRPRVNKRIVIGHASSGSQITLDLSDMQDGAGRMVAEAFDAAALAKQMRVERIYDLDTAPAPASGSDAPGSPSER